MSTPIKETPILRGKDARRFTEKITRNEQEPAPREEYDKLMANYRGNDNLKVTHCDHAKMTHPCFS